MNIHPNGFKVLCGLFAVAAVAHAGHAVSAQPISERQELVVGYADLNLAAAPGVEALYQRIERAGARVCGPQPHGYELRRFATWNDCRSAAIAEAVQAVNLPMLTAVHRDKAPRASAPIKASARLGP